MQLIFLAKHLEQRCSEHGLQKVLVLELVRLDLRCDKDRNWEKLFSNFNSNLVLPWHSGGSTEASVPSELGAKHLAFYKKTEVLIYKQQRKNLNHFSFHYSTLSHFCEMAG